MNRKYGIVSALLLLASCAHAESEDFVFAPAYMLPAGKSAVEATVDQTKITQPFVDSRGFTGKVEGLERRDGIAYRYGMGERDGVIVDAYYTANASSKFKYDVGPEFDFKDARKFDPAIGYEHLFTDRASAFKYAGFLTAGRVNEKPGANAFVPGLDAQYRCSENVLLYGGVSYHWFSNDSFAKETRVGVGAEWRLLPALTLAAGTGVYQLRATAHVTAHTDENTSLYLHYEFMPARYFSLSLTDFRLGSGTNQGWLFKSSTNSVGVGAGFYMGF